MTRIKSPRAAITALTLAAFSTVALAAPASAEGYRRRGNDEAAAALALGIGALVVGGILASKAKRRHHYDGHYYEAPRHYAPQHHKYRYHAPYKKHYYGH